MFFYHLKSQISQCKDFSPYITTSSDLPKLSTEFTSSHELPASTPSSEPPSLPLHLPFHLVVIKFFTHTHTHTHTHTQFPLLEGKLLRNGDHVWVVATCTTPQAQHPAYGRWSVTICWMNRSRFSSGQSWSPQQHGECPGVLDDTSEPSGQS